MVRKVNNDDHYANTLHKFAQQYVIDVPALTSFISTGNKHEISVGEPGFPLSVLHMEVEYLLVVIRHTIFWITIFPLSLWYQL